VVMVAQVVEAAAVQVDLVPQDQETHLPFLPLKELMEALEAMNQGRLELVVAAVAQVQEVPVLM
tara:strand:+ start:525 stop:716 length:192 start_codon:yes stop_codon:yes gene_type:complete